MRADHAKLAVENACKDKFNFYEKNIEKGRFLYTKEQPTMHHEVT